ncbi:MAG: nitrogen regulation protein NR(I), partial [Alphaproteobacteria bacterium]|nr:nitrogen regulation protein NR(I) [Alphaproteobacteria bacterium]
AAWLEGRAVQPGTLYHAALAEFERPLLEHALRETEGNQLRAAQLLGINRNTLRKKIGELGIEPERYTRRR